MVLVVAHLWDKSGTFGEVAERVGFEPTRGLRPLRAFQARLFDHSSTSPLPAKRAILQSTVPERDTDF